MSDLRHCGLAADTKIETPEGSMTIRACAGKAIPVLSRDGELRLLFRMMLDVRPVAESHPIVRITLENGDSFRAAPEQELFRADGAAVAARDLAPGMALLPAFHYPQGYEYRTDAGESRVSERSLAVRAVAADGTAEVYSLGVKDTGVFFVAAGVLCRAER